MQTCVRFCGSATDAASGHFLLLLRLVRLVLVRDFFHSISSNLKPNQGSCLRAHVVGWTWADRSGPDVDPGRVPAAEPDRLLRSLLCVIQNEHTTSRHIIAERLMAINIGLK